jgi:hypothetical protein
MTHIVKVRYQGLWNSEYPLVVARLINTVEAHNPQALRLQRSFGRLAEFRPALVKIAVQEKADRDSALLSELDQQRDTLFNVIYGVAKAFKRTPMAEPSGHGTQILTILEKHGVDIPTANYTAETKRLYDLDADIRSRPDVMDSLQALSLRPLFERMGEVNSEFDRLFVQRHERQSETELIDIRAIRLECDKAIASLWSAIEFCMDEYGETEYIPLVNAINTANTYYKRQLAARAARRKSGKEVDTEEPIDTESVPE